MGSQLTALKVNTGESFLLRTHHNAKAWSILVDSGKKSGRKNHPLVRSIEQLDSKLKCIDIAICTHQDSDHAGGFKSFADVWCSGQRTIGEYWLPGRWAVAVPDVLSNPDILLMRLVLGAIDAARILSEGLPRQESEFNSLTLEERFRNRQILSQLEERFGEVGGRQSELQVKEKRLALSLGLDPATLAALHAQLEETDRENHESLYFGSPRFVPEFPFSFPVDLARDLIANYLLNNALEVAKSIYWIVASAVRWTIPIRWFDFGLFEKTGTSTGGITGFIEPICAQEIEKPPTKVSNEATLLGLYLSKQNVESLVFLRRETDKEPAALFLGDSRLGFGLNQPSRSFTMPANPPRRRLLVTAPHHGSIANDHAYTVLKQWLGTRSKDPFFVRNGGQKNQQLGYYKNNVTNKACAQCFQCNRKKNNQRVTLSSVKVDWAWPPKAGITC